MKKNKNRFQEYCTGCGLCKSIMKTEFYTDNNGFSYPIINDQAEEKFFDKVCPCGSNYAKHIKSNNIWGDYISLYYGYSTDNNIRTSASSGGLLTTICIYLLKNRCVDGIIQIEADSNIPYKTQVSISTSIDDVIKCMGSRYCISSPLENIKDMISTEKKYAFVGKPCDVASLKLYMENDPVMSKQIVYLFSFFCAGEPSENAQHQLLEKLGCSSPYKQVKLTYRGNGWPGYATAEYNNTKSSITYDESWGKILGRDIRKICRFCFDGIGSFADISCGDAWYLNSDNTPDFSEHAGRNIIFIRSSKGQELFLNIIKSGLINVESANIESLRYMQRYQHERRATMIAKICALIICRKNKPSYSFGSMLKLVKNVKLRSQFRILKGTIQRIRSGKI